MDPEILILKEAKMTDQTLLAPARRTDWHTRAAVDNVLASRAETADKRAALLYLGLTMPTVMRLTTTS